MIRRFTVFLICITFILSNFQYARAQDFSITQLPAPGKLVSLSSSSTPVLLKGLRINYRDPLLLDFLVSKEDSRINGADYKAEIEQLVKYFLTSLTIPEKELWVNLSPYEKNKITTNSLGVTEMGRDMLAQDYILKQLTASLIYPEKDLGKTFWNEVYARAKSKYGTTEIPVNTFNKVWILADSATVIEKDNTAFVTQSHLKVMLEQDYLALKKNSVILSETKDLKVHKDSSASPQNDRLVCQVVREIILPQLEKEVNTGVNFAPLRQIFNSFVLSTWYKKRLKNAILNQVYTDKAKVNGVQSNDPAIKEKIYERYVTAYKRGVFNYIKEENGPQNTVIPRKYFSGGTVISATHVQYRQDPQAFAEELNAGFDDATVSFVPQRNQASRAMLTVDSLVKERTSNTFDVLDLINANILEEDVRNASVDITKEAITNEIRDNVWEFFGRPALNSWGPKWEKLQVRKIQGPDGRKLKYGYALDWDNETIYVSSKFLSEMTLDPDRKIHFLERKIIDLFSFDQNQGRENEYKYVKQSAHLNGKFRALFPSLTAVPEVIQDKIRENLLIDPDIGESRRTPEDYRATMAKILDVDLKLIKIIELQQNSALNQTPLNTRLIAHDPTHNPYFVVAPQVGAIAANEQAYEQAKTALNIIAMNAMDGIANYRDRIPAKAVDLKNIPNVIEVAQLSSKFNPITIAHLVVTILSVYALSGASNYYVDISQFDPRKKEIEKSFEQRKELAHLEVSYFFDHLVRILDSKGESGVLEKGELEKWNGEEVLYLLIQQALLSGKKGLRFIYTAGADHFKAWALDAKIQKWKRDFRFVTFDRIDEFNKPYFSFYINQVENGWKAYQDLVRTQLNNTDADLFYDENLKLPQDFHGPEYNMALRKKVIADILNADSKEALQKVFEEAPILPRLDTVGKIYIFQESLGKDAEIVYACTVRGGEVPKDAVRDHLIAEQKISVMQVQGIQQDVAASFTRAGLIKSLYRVFDFNALFGNTKRLFAHIFDPKQRELILSYLIRQDKGWRGPHALQVMSPVDSEKATQDHDSKFGKLKDALKFHGWNIHELPYYYSINQSTGEVEDVGRSTIVASNHGNKISMTYQVLNKLNAKTGEPQNDLLVGEKTIEYSPNPSDMVSLEVSEAITEVILDYVKDYNFINGEVKLPNSAMASLKSKSIPVVSPINPNLRGGIKFDENDLNLNVENQDNGMEFQISPDELRVLQSDDFNGLKPNVLRIIPSLVKNR